MKKLGLSLGITAGLSLLFAPLGIVLGVFLLMVTGGLMFSGAGLAMSTLPLTQFDALHATVLKRSDERSNVTYFLSSFFNVQNVDNINVAFNTKSNNKKVAIDINYQTNGVLHKRRVESTEMVQIPQYMKFTNLTLSDLYTGVALAPLDRNIFEFGRVIANDLHDIADEIDRARELQAAQVFANGIVLLQNNDNINFGRSGSSIVTAGAYWTSSTGDPISDLTAGVSWIRSNTNNTSGVWHVIMGESAVAGFLANAGVLAALNNRRVEIGKIAPMQAEASGGNYIGEFITNSGQTIRVWGYDAKYTNSAGTDVSLVNKNNVIIIPSQNNLTMVNGTIKTLPGTMNVGSFRGKTQWENMDYKAQAHEYYLAENFVAIPQELNEIYTLKATNVS